MPSKRRTLVLDALMLSGPLLVVVGVRAFLAPAPSVGATPAPGGGQAPAIVPVVAPTKPSPEQQRAAEWIAGLGPLTDLRSPMAHPEPPPSPPKPTIETPKPPGAVRAPEDPIAGLKFTGILGNNEDLGLAAINGRIYRVGEEVRKGVRLTRIDARNYVIVLTVPDGTERTLRRLEPPPSEGR